MSPFEIAASCEGGAETMIVLAQADAHAHTQADKLVRRVVDCVYAM